MCANHKIVNTSTPERLPPPLEQRHCCKCGKDCTESGGMTADGGWYCCEECFESVMNEDYGVGKWKPTEDGDEDGLGGYYLYLDEETGEWEGTGIFYTEWE